MSNNGNRSPLFNFESDNYPNGHRKGTRITVGNAAMGILLLILGLLLHIPVSKILEIADAWRLFVR